MTVVPVETPVSTPDVLPMPAIAGEAELHTPTPPLAGSLSVMEVVGHTSDVPSMKPALGKGSTVAIAVAYAVPQLLVTVYDISAVPSVIPVSTPERLTVATPGSAEAHTPATASDNVTALETQTTSGPVIVPALGEGLTVATTVAAAIPQLLATV